MIRQEMVAMGGFLFLVGNTNKNQIVAQIMDRSAVRPGRDGVFQNEKSVQSISIHL